MGLVQPVNRSPRTLHENVHSEGSMGSLSSFHMAYFCSSNRWPDAHVTTVAPPGQKQDSGVRACGLGAD